MNDHDVFSITPAGEAALAEARITAALEALPGFTWDPADLADVAHQAAVAATGR